MVKLTLATLAASVILTGCTTTTVTATDGTTTKTTTPNISLWEHGFDLADAVMKTKKVPDVSAPSKGN